VVSVTFIGAGEKGIFELAGHIYKHGLTSRLLGGVIVLECAHVHLEAHDQRVHLSFYSAHMIGHNNICVCFSHGLKLELLTTAAFLGYCARSGATHRCI
jgi:hypothetical protein